MPLPIVRLPCYVCNSNQEKPIPNSDRKERLTRCVGAAYLVKFYREGIATDESGQDQLADWVVDEKKRKPVTGCSATTAGEDRYFHQSCVQREQAGALSYDNKEYHFTGTPSSGQQPVLRNISHKCCGDCISAARSSDPEEQRLRNFKYERVSGTPQSLSSSWFPHKGGMSLSMLQVDVPNCRGQQLFALADKEAADLERQRGDRRASKGRASVSAKQAKLQDDGTTSTSIFTTRSLNKKIAYSDVSKTLPQSAFIAAVELQTHHLKARGAGPGAASGRSHAAGCPGREAGPSQLPHTQQAAISRRHLSDQAAEGDIVSRWKAHSLGSATRNQLLRFLQDRGVRPNTNTRGALLARVEELLRVEHPEGGTLLLQPLDLGACSTGGVASNIHASQPPVHACRWTGAPSTSLCRSER